MGIKQVAAKPVCRWLSPGGAIRLLVLAFFTTTLLHAAYQAYRARRPLAHGGQQPGGEQHPERVDAAEKRVLSNLNADPGSVDQNRRVLWLDSQGTQTTMPADYVISKAFGGMKPTNILPYYYRANLPPDPEGITVATLVTKDRFPVLERQVRHFRGHFSVCIHVPDDENKEETLKQLDVVMDAPHMRQFVDIHMVIDTHERQFNMWRNIARFFARSEFVMMLDVDFFLCTDVRQSVLGNPEHLRLLREENATLVVPAFEFADAEEGRDASFFPRTKPEVVELYRSRRLVMFHSAWVRGHNLTDYGRWTNEPQVYRIAGFHYSYEPYVIMRKDSVAWCDERFVGYGSNKAACLFELYLSGTDFWVLPDDFLIHQSHLYPEDTRKNQRAYNKLLYETFREEACFRYARILVSRGLWRTPKSRNIRNVCGRIPKFNKAINSLS